MPSVFTQCCVILVWDPRKPKDSPWNNFQEAPLTNESTISKHRSITCCQNWPRFEKQLWNSMLNTQNSWQTFFLTLSYNSICMQATWYLFWKPLRWVPSLSWQTARTSRRRGGQSPRWCSRQPWTLRCLWSHCQHPHPSQDHQHLQHHHHSQDLFHYL